MMMMMMVAVVVVDTHAHILTNAHTHTHKVRGEEACKAFHQADSAPLVLARVLISGLGPSHVRPSLPDRSPLMSHLRTR